MLLLLYDQINFLRRREARLKEEGPFRIPRRHGPNPGRRQSGNGEELHALELELELEVELKQTVVMPALSQ